MGQVKNAKKPAEILSESDYSSSDTEIDEHSLWDHAVDSSDADDDDSEDTEADSEEEDDSEDTEADSEEEGINVHKKTEKEVADAPELDAQKDETDATKPDEESDTSEDEGINVHRKTEKEVADAPEPDAQKDETDATKPDEESDSSEDEVPNRNTIGNVPFGWYKDEEHIGYDVKGKKIRKQGQRDKIDSFLNSIDDTKNWRKIYDEYNDEEIELTKEEIRIIQRLMKGKTPHAEVDPYADSVDWFEYEDKGYPLSNAPEPKRRFVPSKWEAKKVVKYVRAIRNGWIKFDKPKEEPQVYLLWGDDGNAIEKDRKHPSFIPPPKPKLPGHEVSFRPPPEYIPTQEEINSYQLLDEEDRPKYIPRRHESLRSVPAYDNALKEQFERCLDLYLCPRAHKKRIHIDPESLKPKLPSKKDLRPYPTTCYIEYRGHTAPVTSISVESSGQWIASGSTDGTVRVWDVDSGRCFGVWNVGEAIKHVAWNPSPKLPILAISAGHDVIILNTGLGDSEEEQIIQELFNITPNENADESPVSWVKHSKLDALTLQHFKAVSTVEWHKRGDYFTSVMPAGDSKAILIHLLSTKQTQNSVRKLGGLPVASVFHPTKSCLVVATKRSVRVYDLKEGKLFKKLETRLQQISSISVHPKGDNIIVGTKEGKMCWFDMDLSTQPYKTLKIHPKDISNVAFHQSYPLFASCSDDCTAYLFHGKVFDDLNENPLIVPLEILRGHSSFNGRGVLDCKFHPKQPWLFTAGADSVIKLYCN